MNWTELNRISVPSTTMGTISFVLSDTPVSGGHSPFPASLDGVQVRYTAVRTSSDQYEVGEGYYTHATRTLSRDTIEQSSSGGSRVNFSAAPVVFIAPSAGWYQGVEAAINEFQAVSSIRYADPSEPNQAVAGNGSSVYDLIEDMGDVSGTIVFAPFEDSSDANGYTNYTFQTGIVIPDNIKLIVLSKAKLKFTHNLEDIGMLIMGSGGFEFAADWCIEDGTYYGNAVWWPKEVRSEVKTLWFGATGRVTDDSTNALKSCFNALPAGGTVHIANGDYVISEVLNPPSHTDIIGESRDGVRIYTNVVKELFYIKNRQNMGLENLTFLPGNSVFGFETAPVKFNFVRGARLKNVRVADIPDGIRFSDVEQFYVESLEIEDNTLLHDPWKASTLYSVGDYIKPAAYPYAYVCTVAGTSGGSEPAWGGVEVTDNEVTWHVIHIKGMKLYANARDGRIEKLKLTGAFRNTPVEIEEGSDSLTWDELPSGVSSGTFCVPSGPSPDTVWYAIHGGTKGVTEPLWSNPDENDQIIDGTVTWQFYSAYGLPHDLEFDDYSFNGLTEPNRCRECYNIRWVNGRGREVCAASGGTWDIRDASHIFIQGYHLLNSEARGAYIAKIYSSEDVFFTDLLALYVDKGVRIYDTLCSGIVSSPSVYIDTSTPDDKRMVREDAVDEDLTGTVHAWGRDDSKDW